MLQCYKQEPGGNKGATRQREKRIRAESKAWGSHATREGPSERRSGAAARTGRTSRGASQCTCQALPPRFYRLVPYRTQPAPPIGWCACPGRTPRPQHTKQHNAGESHRTLDQGFDPDLRTIAASVLTPQQRSHPSKGATWLSRCAPWDELQKQFSHRLWPLFGDVL